MQLYLAAAPEQEGSVTCPLSQRVRAAYRTDGTHLLSSPLPPQLRGGMLLLSDREAPSLSDPDTLAREVMQECLRRNYSAVVLDFESVRDDRFPARMAAWCSRYKRRLYVPETFADTAGTSVLVCTAVTGGSLRSHLQQAIARYGTGRVALDLQRLMTDYPLPSSGIGSSLPREEWAKLAAGRPIYFSDELCARYFTWRSGSQMHFVLYDDADTMQRKIALGDELGIAEGFLMYPEVEDIAEKLMG